MSSSASNIALGRKREAMELSGSNFLGAPNPDTIADGYSRTDERIPVLVPDVDFNYDASETRQMEELPQLNAPKIHQSHPGEHRGDFGGIPVHMSSKVYVWALCAALNSCNLGYDIGVNTSAGPILQEDMGLSTLQVEMFFGSINFFAMFGSLLAHVISDRFGRRHAFAVSLWDSNQYYGDA